MSTTYSETDVGDQTGRTYLVTGANTGIGFEAARVLAGKGARVLLGCRSEQRASEALASIQKQHPTADVHWQALDLASLESIRTAAAQVSSDQKQLHGLINNAGVMMPPKSLTTDGFELQFGVNHLGHFALTGLLLDTLASTPGARVVNVSSLAHLNGRIDFQDPQAERIYGKQTRYGMSKAANMYFTVEFAKRAAAHQVPVLAAACHPGIAMTELARHMPAWQANAFGIARALFNTQAEGALPTLLAATGGDVMAGDYYGPTRRMETARGAGRARIGDQIRDEAAAARLWSLSEELTGVHYLS